MPLSLRDCMSVSIVIISLKDLGISTICSLMFILVSVLEEETETFDTVKVRLNSFFNFSSLKYARGISCLFIEVDIRRPFFPNLSDCTGISSCTLFILDKAN